MIQLFKLITGEEVIGQLEKAETGVLTIKGVRAVLRSFHPVDGPQATLAQYWVGNADIQDLPLAPNQIFSVGRPYRNVENAYRQLLRLPILSS